MHGKRPARSEDIGRAANLEARLLAEDRLDVGIAAKPAAEQAMPDGPRQLIQATGGQRHA